MESLSAPPEPGPLSLTRGARLAWPRPPADWRAGGQLQVSGPLASVSWGAVSAGPECTVTLSSRELPGSPRGGPHAPFRGRPGLPTSVSGLQGPGQEGAGLRPHHWLDVVLHRDGLLHTQVGAGPQDRLREPPAPAGLPREVLCKCAARGASGHTRTRSGDRHTHPRGAPALTHTLRVIVTYTLRAPRSHSHTLGAIVTQTPGEPRSHSHMPGSPGHTHTHLGDRHTHAQGAPAHTLRVPRSHSHTLGVIVTHTPGEPWSYSHTLRRSSHTRPQSPGYTHTHSGDRHTHAWGAQVTFSHTQGTQVTHTLGVPRIHLCTLEAVTLTHIQGA